MNAIITVVGSDKVGIIATVSSFLSEHKINIEDITQTILSGNFVMMMMVSFGSADITIDELRQQMNRKAEEILSVIKDRYGWLFNEENMRIIRTNNIQLGRFKDEYNHGMYGNQMFTFYLNNPEYIIRRQNFAKGVVYGTPSKLIEIATAEIGYHEKATNANLDSKTANSGRWGFQP